MQLRVCSVNQDNKKIPVRKFQLSRDPFDFKLNYVPRIRNLLDSSKYQQNALIESYSEVLSHIQNKRLKRKKGKSGKGVKTIII